MNSFKVKLILFGSLRAQIKTVEVDLVIEAEKVAEVPEKVFELANAPWMDETWQEICNRHPQPLRSMSVGDIVLVQHEEFGEFIFQCLSCGWKQISLFDYHKVYSETAAMEIFDRSVIK